MKDKVKIGDKIKPPQTVFCTTPPGLLRLNASYIVERMTGDWYYTPANTPNQKEVE